jgi:uncharacterized protein (DUF1015 family)
MAIIKAFQGLRYKSSLPIKDLTSPLFDVVSLRQRQKLYLNPLNSIHISVPIGENPNQSAAKTLSMWKESGILAKDTKPAIYPYYQYFNLHHKKKTFCRKGFIAMIEATDWHEKIVLRHENTIPSSVNDRIELLKQTSLNSSPTHGLYSDRNFELEYYMDEAMNEPIYDVEDYQGVRDVLAKIDDPEIIEKFVANLRGKKVILADGHHRYEASLAYRQACKSENPSHTGNEAYNFHLMYLTNLEADDLRILPTHRLVKNIEPWDETAFLEKIALNFEMIEIEDPSTVEDVIAGKPHSFGLLLKDKFFKIKLKADLKTMTWSFENTIKELDVTVLHYYIIKKALSIKGKDQRSTPHISYERSFSDALQAVQLGAAQAAIITNEIPIETVKKVCYSGSVMPQKSTYFYPKVLCGLVFAEV